MTNLESLETLAGELPPDSGTVELGETVKIGHFSQEGRELDLNQRVYDFIYSVAAQVKTDEGTFSAKTMLERFLFPPDLQQTTIGRLSGGERRRLYLLSILMAAPNVLLLDEPTRGIDVGAKYEIYQLILDLANKGKTVIMVSSEMPELLGVCDRILVMSGGRLAGEVDAKTATQEDIMRLAAKYV